MASEQSLWKRAFDAAEKAVAPKLEAAVRTEQFAETASALTKLQARARDTANVRSQQAMHNLNLPTASDVRKLREQVTSLERVIRELSKQLDRVNERLSENISDRKESHTGSTKEKVKPNAKPAQSRRPRNANKA